MQKQIECPKCESYKTNKASPKAIVGGFAIASAFIGMALAIFVVGIPFLLFAVVLGVASIFCKENGKMRCRSCNYIFIK